MQMRSVQIRSKNNDSIQDQLLKRVQRNASIILKQQKIKMGICKHKQNEADFRLSTKAAQDTKNFGQMQLYFTTQNLLRIDADCLVIYCDEKMNLAKNTFMAKVGKFQTRKITQFAESHLLTTKAKVTMGKTIFFPISIATLQFRFVGMVCLKVWNGQEKIKSEIEVIMSELFRDLNRHRVQSLAITEFNQQFGIPAQLCCLLLGQELMASKDWLKVVTIISNDTQSQKYYMDKILNFIPQSTSLNSRKQDGKSSSIYY